MNRQRWGLSETTSGACGLLLPLWCACSSFSKSLMDVPASTLPCRVVSPAWKSSASASVVLPLDRAPASRTLWMSGVPYSGMAGVEANLGRCCKPDDPAGASSGAPAAVCRQIRPAATSSSDSRSGSAPRWTSAASSARRCARTRSWQCARPRHRPCGTRPRRRRHREPSCRSWCR